MQHSQPQSTPPAFDEVPLNLELEGQQQQGQASSLQDDADSELTASKQRRTPACRKPEREFLSESFQSWAG